MGKRKDFLDILRVVATCAVVLLHTLTGTFDAVDSTAYPAERTVFLVMMDLITWCVPVFVLISGYLFLNPEKKITFREMLFKYCRRIVLALFVFGVPFALLELLMVERTFYVSMLWKSVVMVLQGKTWSHMWYLYMILLLYLLTPAIKWILARVPGGCVYIGLLVLFLFSSVFTFVNKLLGMSLPALSDGWIYLFYYICGYLFATGKHVVGKKGWQLLCCGVLLLLLAGMAMSRIVCSFSVQMAYNYPFTVAVALLLFYIAKNTGTVQTAGVKGLQKLSALCFAIYLIHPVFVNVLYKVLHVSLLDYPIGISLPAFWLVILVLSTMGAWLLHKISLLKKYVL